MEILITTPFHPAYMSKERLQKASKLKLIMTAGVGSDHIDLNTAAEKGMTVVEVSGTQTFPGACNLGGNQLQHTCAHVHMYMGSHVYLRTWLCCKTCSTFNLYCTWRLATIATEAAEHCHTLHQPSGSNVTSVAEDEVMRILVLIRNFLPARDQIVNGDWNVPAVAVESWDLMDKTVGTVGGGRIGYHMMKRLRVRALTIAVLRSCSCLSSAAAQSLKVLSDGFGLSAHVSVYRVGM